MSKYTQLGLQLEDFLVTKSQSLVSLAQYLRSFFPTVSYATRQTLLLDAEKAAATKHLWSTWGKRLDTFDAHERGTQILESVVKDMRREATGEAVYVDVVREWFRNEVLPKTVHGAYVSGIEDWRFDCAIVTSVSEICTESVWKGSHDPCKGNPRSK